MDSQNTWEHDDGQLDLVFGGDVELLDEDGRDDEHQDIAGQRESRVNGIDQTP